MVSSSQIRERLAMFLNGWVDLDMFEDWFVQSTWNVHLFGSKATELLTFEIEESLAEFSSGHLTYDQLRAELQRAIQRDNIVVSVNEATQKVFSLAAAAPVSAAWRQVQA